MHIVPATANRWPDLEHLFGENGACAGCWCMWWRYSSQEYKADKGEGNRRKLQALLEQSDTPPGLLAYATDDTGELDCAGWVAVAPRSEYPRMERGSVLRRIDAQPVWSVSCLFIAKPYRRQGLSITLIDAAARHAFAHGAAIVEGYPFDPKREAAPAFIWTGTTAAYQRAGFAEVARNSPARPIMRRYAAQLQ
jgi:GNAT superfamily N-acetyltransferase